jgi:hypothetical protein
MEGAVKTFNVTTASYSEGRTYTNIVPVNADYVKNENGVLIFKREVSNSYPEVVGAFAPGRWLEFAQA